MDYKEFCELTSKAKEITEIAWRDWTTVSELALKIEWETGGREGGNCWDDTEPRSYITSDPEPNFDSLDQLLESACPDISFLKYKNICSEVIVSGSREQNEYYGNCTSYAYRYVDMKKLYDCLVDKGLIND